MERSNAVFTIGLLTAVMLALPFGAACGDTSAQAETKPGFHTGDFRIRPTLSLTQTFDDNVFNTDRNTRSDWITLVSPSVKVDSTWESHRLHLSAGAESGTHWRYNDEDYLDYWGRIEGRYRAGGNTDVFAALGYSDEHEGRDAPDSSAGQLEPTTFSTIDANLGLRHSHGDTTLRMGGTYETLEFDDAPAVGGPIRNDDRDRKLLGAGIRATVGLQDEHSIFVQAQYDHRSYDRDTDRYGYERSSDGYRAAVGLMRDWSGGSLEGYVGIISQDYDDRRFDRINRPDFGGRLKIFLNDRTRLTMTLRRSLNETTEIGSPGYLDTAFSSRLEHDISPRFIPYLGLEYSDYDFLETGREDKTYAAGAGLKYFVTRNAHIVLGAHHRSRDSNDKGTPVGSNDFDQTSLFLNLTARLYPL